MDTLIQAAQTISPIGVIFLLIVVIYQLLDGKGVLSSIRGTQKEKYPQLEEFMNAISNLTQQNDTLLENHFKHEIPDMSSTMNRLETKTDRMIEILTQINTKLK